MTEYRFILEEMYRQIRRPIPFGLFNPEVPAGVEPSMDSIENLTDDQLAELLVTNAKGVPMVFPLYFAVEGGPWWLLPY